jgi:uncharacterized protein with beta-barrel porin domain
MLRRAALLGCASTMVLAAGLVPSRAEQQVINFFVNGGGFYDKTGYTPAGVGQTGCCYSYVGPAQSGTPGHNSTPHNTHPAITFQTTSSGNGAISEAKANVGNVGTRGHPIAGVNAGDAYDGFGGVGLVGSNNFGGLTVNRDTEVTHGPGLLPTALTTPFLNAGVPNAARFVETITNNTGAPISGTFGFFSNLGSDAATLYVANNHGTLVGGPPVNGSLWITSIQNTNSGPDPVLTVVLGNNKYTATSVQTRNFAGGSLANGDDNPAYLYPITVKAGQTIRIVLFSILTADVNFNPGAVPGNAVASMQSDITLGGQMANIITNNGAPLPVNSPFFVGLTLDEIKSIINFDFLFAFQLNGANVNQNNVANAVNTFLNNGGDSNLIAGLFGLTDAQLNAEMSLLSGENSTGAQTTAFQSMDAFLGLLLNPYNLGRTDSIGMTPGGGTLGYAEETSKRRKYAASRAIDSAYASAATATFDQRWTAWGSAYGGYAAASGNAVIGSTNMQTHVGGFAAGLDYHVDPNTILGFGLAGGTGSWGLAQGMGGGHMNDFQAGLYARHVQGPWYWAVAGAFATHDVDTNRTISIGGVGGNYTASFEAATLGARGEGGYRIDLQPFGVTPYAALQSQVFQLPGYAETTTGGTNFLLAYASKAVRDTRTEIGSWFDYRLTAPMPVTLFSRVAWVHDFNTDRTATATFQTLPGASFVVNGASPAHDSALTTIGARIAMGRGWTLAGQIDGEEGGGWHTIAGNATLRKTW